MSLSYFAGGAKAIFLDWVVLWQGASLKFLARRQNTTTMSRVTPMNCAAQSSLCKFNHPPSQLNINTRPPLEFKPSRQAVDSARLLSYLLSPGPATPSMLPHSLSRIDEP